MIVKVIGARRLDFTTKDGDTIKGLKVFVTYPSDENDKSFLGEVADSVFIKDGSRIGNPMFELNKKYDFVYNATSLGGRPTLTEIRNEDGTPVEQSTESVSRGE